MIYSFMTLAASECNDST